MFNMFIKNEQGTTLIEILISIVLLAIGIFGVLTVFPLGWSSTARADRIGQASEIMHREMEAVQMSIQNPCIGVAAGAVNVPVVYAGGQAAPQQGDVQYSVTRTITDLGNNTWRVAVQVTWTGNAVGIRDSIIVGRDENFRAGC